MNWLESLQNIEELEDAEFDAALVAEMERSNAANLDRLVRFSTPTFKEYESSELQNQNRRENFDDCVHSGPSLQACVISGKPYLKSASKGSVSSDPDQSGVR